MISKSYFSYLRVMLLALLLVLVVTPLAAQSSENPWTAVLWALETDTLHWVTAEGEQRSTPRPQLPDEDPAASAQIKLSPDGRYLVVTALLNNGNQGIGFYDIAADVFTKTHEAAVSEIIDLGHQSSSPDSARIAVGLAGTDPAAPSWRVLVFEYATGDALAQLVNSDVGSDGEAAAFLPSIVFYDLQADGREVVHFQMYPFNSIPGAEVAANAWDVAANAIANSPYTALDSDIALVSGAVVFPVTNPNVEALPVTDFGLNHNTIAAGLPAVASLDVQDVWVDGSRYISRARWLNDGAWVGYFAQGGADAPQWNVVANAPAAENQAIALAANIVDIIGTPDGYLAVSEDNGLYHVTELISAESFGEPIFQASEIFQVVYVSPDLGDYVPPVRVTATEVPAVEAEAQPETEGDTETDVEAAPEGEATQFAMNVCDGAPATRLAAGARARVSGTLPLRIRAEPGGAILTQIASNAEFDVTEGPACQGEYTWWRIRTANGTEGWSAEGSLSDYFIEPIGEVPLLQPTSVPTVPPITPAAPVTEPETEAETEAEESDVTAPVIVPTMEVVELPTLPECNLAPPTRLGAGVSAVTESGNSTLALYFNPGDEFPTYNLPHGSAVVVLGESRCRAGYRIWPVQAVVDGQNVTGWVTEGMGEQYFLNPVQ